MFLKRLFKRKPKTTKFTMTEIRNQIIENVHLIRGNTDNVHLVTAYKNGSWTVCCSTKGGCRGFTSGRNGGKNNTPEAAMLAYLKFTSVMVDKMMQERLEISKKKDTVVYIDL
ncbi:MAG: NADPH--cytochrome P450 reductase [Aureobasidium pullulans]|nr:MAG: NADPH--cytochrome P450 reductase [Aureobasidium pullulans]